MYDFIIIGGGIVGMTTARELASEDLKIAVIDSGEAGKESTWAAGGILSPMRPWAEHHASAVLSTEGKRCYPGFVESLLSATGIDTEYIKSGLLMVGKDDIQNTMDWALAGKINWLQGKVYIPSDLTINAPAIFLPDIAQVRPSRLIKALKKDLVQKKVDIFEHSRVMRIDIEQGRFQAVRTNDRKISSYALIVCAGAWSAGLLRCTGLKLCTRPVNGQMLCVHANGAVFKEMVLDGNHYLIPRIDGHVLIGSSMEDTGFEKFTSRAVADELGHWALSVWPGMAQSRLVCHWAGLRPSNAFGKPYIGKVPGVSGIYANTAHFRKGILQAQASARLLTDYLLEKQSFTDIDNYQTPG